MDLSTPVADLADRLLQVEVASAKYEADDIVEIELRSPDGEALPCFTAGSHIDVHLPQGRVRQYSLFNDPVETGRYCIAVLREATGRGGSAAMHMLRSGDRLLIGAPRNLFTLRHAPRSLLLAGGIGITPLIAMAQVLAREGRAFHLHYFVRNRRRTALRVLVDRLASSTSLHVEDETGRADFSLLLQEQPPQTHLYFCGPPGFMDAVETAASRMNWPATLVHKEHFGPAGDAAALSSKDRAFLIRLASSSRIIRVGANQSAAESLEAAGIPIITSCGQGICGACVTRVVSGVPDHRDHVLSNAERASGSCFTPCCSRALSEELVLDL